MRTNRRELLLGTAGPLRRRPARQARALFADADAAAEALLAALPRRC
jgi:hypothetical protein